MKQYEFEQFAAVRNQAGISFSPDGEWVSFVSNASGQFNVWKQPVVPGRDGKPLMPVQLTALVEEIARQAIWSPDGSRILTMADRQGTENYQLFEVPAADGWLYPLTDNPDSRYELPARPFSPEGKTIAYSSNVREASDMDIILRDLDSGEERSLLAGGNYYMPADWSPDGNYLLGMKISSNTDQDIVVIEVESGEFKYVTPHEGEIRYQPSQWAPDGSGFYLITDQDREFGGLAFYDMEGGKLRWVETPDWDVQDCALSRDGRYLAWVVNEGGFFRLYVRDHSNDQVTQFKGLPEGVILDLAFNPAHAILGFYLHRAEGPGELYMLNVETQEHWQLSQNFLGGVPAPAMVSPELIHYPSHDGREIPAFLFKPANLNGEKAPAILSIHGGPESQELPRYAYNGLYQYLLNRGIGIIATNIRGSTGYGKTYQKLIHRDWGGDELKDLDYAARYLKQLDWVDEERMGVFGGSFGGFATLSCVSRLPDYWAAAVDIVGVSNLITFVKSVPQHWRRFMTKWVGDPEDDYDLLVERSPITYVDDIKAPLLVIQGANDPRVVKPESDQMVDRLRELGREVDYMVFEDEGHGFSKVSNSLKALRASAKWFEKHLLI